MNPLFDAIMPIAARPDIVFTSGKGSWLMDSVGRHYLDFVQGWAVNGLGHCHPAIVRALQEQCATLINPSPAFYNQPMLELASLLTENSHFDHVFFANSGAEANEGAIKLARKWGSLYRGGAHKIITFDNGFHGRTLATMSASGKVGWDKLFEPKVPGFIKVPFNDIEAVKQAIDSQTVAVMLEPVQGEAGVIPARQAFVEELRALTHQHNMLLIFDEVQTGMGRLGSLLACQQLAVEPDILTLGKGIGGGVPLAALLAKRAASCFEAGDQGGTYNGNPLCCAAGIAVLNTLLEPGFLQQVVASGEYLAKGLTQLSGQYELGEVRGRGLLLALNTASIDARQIVAAALEQGLLINAPRPETLRFMPALTVSSDEIDTMLSILNGVIGRYASP